MPKTRAVAMLAALGRYPPSLAPGGSRFLCSLARPGSHSLSRNVNRPLRPVVCTAAAALIPVPAVPPPPPPLSARHALSTKSRSPSSPPSSPSPSPSPSARPGSSSPKGPPQPQLPIPARLLIYHGSTARITFLACLRLGTLFICVFFCLAVAPAYLRDSGGDSEALLKAGAAVLSGMVPFVFVYLSTAPFVAFIHLPLPPFARQSNELLKRFAANVPNTTSLEITTISLIGKPRVTRVPVASMVPTRARLGIVNYVVRPGPASAARSLLSRPPTNFSIQHNSRRDAREAWVWDLVAAAISRRSST
ncbi:hypothetical protein MAPG_07712 [Magnaporthiopsis poae ATCC 64411]|uniref:Uncharacterized protein n=1 Tax=Magnaporthiopsis poae (strain ATCC 64411 / 73-15) TaxID=644358 RepID=A0A0C4E5E6_MAGP6|nr:hypothetical protein MAPG_07712 [Magnaporthiopsis poae ATCC 64411]